MIKGLKRLGPQKWAARITWVDPKTGQKRSVQKTFAARSEQQAGLIRAQISETLRTNGATAKRLRLGDYARSWIADKSATVKPSTARVYADRLEKRVLPTLGQHYIDAIEHADIVAWRDAQTGSTETINGCLRVLKTLFADAVVELELPRNPAMRVKTLPRTVTTLEAMQGRGLTVTELRATLAHVQEHSAPWYPLVLTLALTGMRFGEATALQWDDIDFAAGSIAIKRAQWQGHVGHPKAAASRRMVPMPDELALTLREHRKTRLRHQLHAALPWVFVSTVGTLHNTSVLAKPMRAALAAAGVRRRVPQAHCLRHTYNNLVRQVTSEVVRQSLVGHADAAVGQRYSAVSLEEKRQASDAVAKVVRL